jgi:uncharacterized protein (TIGR02147 family)
MTEAKARNPAFSVRALARKMGLSPAMTSRVLSGKRNVSLKLARQITEALLLDPQERSEILSLFPEKKPLRSDRPTDQLDPLYLQLNADHFRMISEWHYFAILSLMKTRAFKSDFDWIGERLGLAASQVEQAVERLIRLELITRDDSGNLLRSPSKFRTSDDVVNLSVRKALFEGLDLARHALETEPLERRDFTSLTLAFPSSRMNEAKEMIRKFQDAFDARFEAGEPENTDEVYRLTVGLFPLTRRKGGRI